MISFDFTHNYILEDEVVRLVPLETTHLSKLLPIATEADIWTYSFVKGHNSKQLQAYIEASISERQQGKEYPFLVIDKRTNKVAGCTRFYEFIPAFQSLKIGYTWYGKAFQGTGLNKHCKFVLFQFAFEKMEVERIGLGAYAENQRSIAAMKSVGCIEEGIGRAYLPAVKGPGRTDAIYFSLLKSDWEQTVKQQLKQKLRTTK